MPEARSSTDRRPSRISPTTYGGQAVLEGVMMRGRRWASVAVRAPNKQIVVRSERLPVHLYGGWDYIAFAPDQSFAGVDHDFEETGYTYGLRFEHPFGAATGMLYRLEAGGTYKHVEIEDADGDIVADSEHSVGFEFGAGAVFNANSNWRFVPMLRYRSLSPDFTIGSVTTEGTLQYVGLELGLSRRF